MKMFALFAGADYYPQGGMRDLVALFDDAEEACAAGARLMGERGRWGFEYEWWHVADMANMSRVAYFPPMPEEDW